MANDSSSVPRTAKSHTGQQLEAGMVTMWNGGVTHEIMGVVPSKSGKTFQIQYMDGHLDRRKMRKGSLIAIA